MIDMFVIEVWVKNLCSMYRFHLPINTNTCKIRHTNDYNTQEVDTEGYEAQDHSQQFSGHTETTSK